MVVPGEASVRAVHFTCAAKNQGIFFKELKLVKEAESCGHGDHQSAADYDPAYRT